MKRIFRILAILGAVLVVLAGKYFARRKKHVVIEVAVEQQESKP